jgi:protein required for attachment to host cells
MITWVLVSDAHHARLFAVESRDGAWTLEREFVREAPEQSSLDGGTSPAEVQGLSEPHTRPTVDEERRTPPDDLDSRQFARRTIQRLQQALDQGDFNYLVLVAPPRFLELLRRHVTGRLAWQLRAIVAEDLTSVEERELREQLLDSVFPDGLG